MTDNTVTITVTAPMTGELLQTLKALLLQKADAAEEEKVPEPSDLPATVDREYATVGFTVADVQTVGGWRSQRLPGAEARYVLERLEPVLRQDLAKGKFQMLEARLAEYLKSRG